MKLATWLDRSEHGHYKDAADLATVLYWYDTSDQVRDRRYGTDHGVGILERVEWDVSAAAAILLGEDTAAIVGPDRCSELLTRWPGSRNETPSQ